MTRLILLVTLGVVATFAAPQTPTAAPVFASNPGAYDYYRNNPYNNYYGNNPYRNNYNPYYRNNGFYGNDRYNKNDPYYRNNYDPYYRNNYDSYNRNQYDYRKNYVTGAEGNARILRFDNNVQPDGSYVYGYDTNNGISVQQEGFPIPTPYNDYVVGVKGQFQYTSPEGRQIITRYVADENGYRPVGNTIGDGVFRGGVFSDPALTPLANSLVHPKPTST